MEIHIMDKLPAPPLVRPRESKHYSQMIDVL